MSVVENVLRGITIETGTVTSMSAMNASVEYVLLVGAPVYWV